MPWHSPRTIRHRSCWRGGSETELPAEGVGWRNPYHRSWRWRRRSCRWPWGRGSRRAYSTAVHWLSPGASSSRRGTSALRSSRKVCIITRKVEWLTCVNEIINERNMNKETKEFLREWTNDQINEWMNVRLTDWVTEWLADWLIVWLASLCGFSCKLIHLVNQRLNHKVLLD